MATERYTVHVGEREAIVPPAVAVRDTRGAAQALASSLLAAAPAEPPHKAEVRERGVRLLDCYGRRGGARVFHIYAAVTRQATLPRAEGVLL
ncbi:MAG: hypothetical protein LC749_22055 [Actinobacteria bacterium]|nr:hypothetical protein [Actinomycetota bacterium]